MRTASLAATLVLAGLLGGCVVVPDQRGHAGYDHGYGGPEVVVDVAPPAPYVEVQPVLPYAGAVWISGYWGWANSRYQWVPGYYDRPRAGYRYEPRRWEPRGGRWQQRGGWTRR